MAPVCCVTSVAWIRVWLLFWETLQKTRDVHSGEETAATLEVVDGPSPMILGLVMEYNSPGSSSIWVLSLVVTLTLIMNLPVADASGREHEIRHKRHNRRHVAGRRFYGESTLCFVTRHWLHLHCPVSLYQTFLTLMLHY